MTEDHTFCGWCHDCLMLLDDFPSTFLRLHDTGHLSFNSEDTDMNTTPNYTTIIEVITGQVIARQVRANVGLAALEAVIATGVTIHDGGVYLTIPVNVHGVPITAQAHTVWRYTAPVMPKGSVEMIGL